MEEYQRLAKERYERAKQVEKAKNLEKEAERKAESDKETELQQFYTTLEEWKNTTDFIRSRELLATLLPIAKKYELMYSIEECVVKLVQYLNEFCEKTALPIPEIRVLQQQMQDIITMSGLDIPVQAMYTEDDEKFATLLQQELFAETVATYPPPNQLPLVHPHKRIGLTLYQMKDIARQNGIMVTGNKEELCYRLVQRGLCELATS